MKKNIYFGDLKRLFFFKRRKIFAFGIAVAIIALFLTGMMRPKYRIVATFKAASSVEEMGSQNSRSSLLKQYSSADMPTQAVTLMSSRLLLSEVGAKLGCQITEEKQKVSVCLWENLLAELGCYLPDVDRFVWCDVRYLGEKRKTCTVIFHSLTEFTFDGKEGKVGELFVGEDLSFFLLKTPKICNLGKPYQFILLPEEEMVSAISKKLSIQLSKYDQFLINLHFDTRDRIFGCNFLNELMASYKRYLIRESDRISSAQLSYLNLRQDELSDKLNLTLKDHASFLEKTAGKKGYIGLEEELNTLRMQKKECESHLFQMELEKKALLSNAIPNESSISEDLLHCKNALYQLGKQRDEIELYLLAQNSVYKKKKAPTNLGNFMKLIEFPRYIEIKTNRLLAVYMSNLVQLKKASVKDNNFGLTDEEGLDWSTARQIELEFFKETSELSVKKQQLLHLLGNMKGPTFDLASLCLVVNDPFSQANSHSAQKTTALLNDDEKKCGLMKAILGLIHKEIALFEGGISKMKKDRLRHLSCEMFFIQNKLDNNHEEMRSITERWLRENLLNLKSNLNLSMIKGMSNLIESKNVENHLKQVESKPIDRAYQPLKPKRRYLVLISLIVGALAAAAIYGYEMIKGLRDGMPISIETLVELGRTVLGKMHLEHCPTSHTEASETILEVLRQAIADVNKGLGIIGKKSYGLAQILAELIALEGKKVLLVDLSFHERSQQPGLWQFLHSEIVQCPIVDKGKFDLIFMGMSTKYGRELLQKKELRTFLATQTENYDAVVLFSPALPKSAEARTMMEFVKNIIVTLERESLNEINEYLRWEDRGNTVSFLASE